MDGTEPDLPELLAEAPLTLVGRVATASNGVYLGRLDGGTGGYVAVKPVSGERPLWDFPDGTLAGRELAAYLVSRAGGWDVVPPTVVRDSELGPAAVQWWVGDPFADPTDLTDVVRVVPAKREHPGWRPVLDGVDQDGAAVTVVHEDAADVRAVAVFDAVVNNADRKGGHLCRDALGRLWGFDHGLTFHPEPKLRTVLWGWSGQPLTPADRARVAAVADALDDETSPLTRGLAPQLPAADIAALRQRVAALLARPVHPGPPSHRPPVPWPVL